MLPLSVWLNARFENEEGQDLIEYAAIVALLVVLAIGGLSVAGNGIASLFSNLGAWVGGILF